MGSLYSTNDYLSPVEYEEYEKIQKSA
jgi:hypothetical protein